jgi:hypothetical protein
MKIGLKSCHFSFLIEAGLDCDCSDESWAWAHQEKPNLIILHHRLKNFLKIAQSFTIMHKYTQLYILDQMDQMVHSELNEGLVRIHLEKWCTTIHYFAFLYMNDGRKFVSWWSTVHLKFITLQCTH